MYVRDQEKTEANNSNLARKSKHSWHDYVSLILFLFLELIAGH